MAEQTAEAGEQLALIAEDARKVLGAERALAHLAHDLGLGGHHHTRPGKPLHVHLAAGAFHVAKPADLIPELQGRFPIRVELGSEIATFDPTLVESFLHCCRIVSV